jgi:hypothetical protein
VYAVKIEDAKERIEGGIRSFLKRQTSTFGNNKSLDVASISFDWPDYWERHRSPQLQVVVRVTDPTTPSYTQVQYIQDRINERMEREFPGLQLQMEVHRINMTVISGNDVTSEPTKLNLERILGQEIIQKIPPPESDNKAEDKLILKLILILKYQTQYLDNLQKIFYTPQKLFGLTSLHEAYIKTKTHTDLIGAASFPAQSSRSLHKPQIYKFIYA